MSSLLNLFNIYDATASSQLWRGVLLSFVWQTDWVRRVQYLDVIPNLLLSNQGSCHRLTWSFCQTSVGQTGWKLGCGPSFHLRGHLQSPAQPGYRACCCFHHPSPSSPSGGWRRAPRHAGVRHHFRKWTHEPQRTNTQQSVEADGEAAQTLPHRRHRSACSDSSTLTSVSYLRLISASVPCFITSRLCPVLCRQLLELQRRVLGVEEKGENEKTKRVTGVWRGIYLGSTSSSLLILPFIGASFNTSVSVCFQRNCSNCGNSFCSRCCSYKVLRACMGATGEWCFAFYFQTYW